VDRIVGVGRGRPISTRAPTRHRRRAAGVDDDWRASSPMPIVVLFATPVAQYPACSPRCAQLSALARSSPTPAAPSRM
jgi:hypothetical protein